MTWTPDAIRAKADSLQARGPGRVTLSAETLQLIVDALRLHASVSARRTPDAYVVEAWSGSPDTKGQAVAMSDKFYAARAAYEAVCQEYPTHRVTLRQGGRVMSVRDSTTVRW